MDEGEEDGAEAFDADGDVLVFLDALDVAFVASEGAAGDPHALACPEIFFAVDGAAGGVGGCEEPQELHGAGRYFLHGVGGWVAVYPEGDGAGVGEAAASLEVEGSLAGGADEHDAGNDGAHACAAVGASDAFFGEVYFAALRCQEGLGAECLAGADGGPGFGGGWCGGVAGGGVVHGCVYFYPCAGRVPRTVLCRPLAGCFGSRGRACTGAFPVVFTHGLRRGLRRVRVHKDIKKNYIDQKKVFFGATRRQTGGAGPPGDKRARRVKRARASPRHGDKGGGGAEGQDECFF